MRLINPGAGEITDRLTILALKILYGEQAGVDVKHFAAEEASLLSQIRSRTLNGSWFGRVLELAAVNAALWHEEDHIREARSAFNVATMTESEIVRLLPGVVVCAFRIQRLNDRRTQMIQEINQLAGDHLGEEKIP